MSDALNTREITPKLLLELAKQWKVRVTDLIALDQTVDPFYANASPAKLRNAQWAYKWWKEFGSPKIHGRGFNYDLMGRAHLPHNNELYDGSDKHYSFCRRALELARYQGLIPYKKIPDHKTKVHINFRTWKDNDINGLVQFNLDYSWIEEQVLEHFYTIWRPYQRQDTVCEAWIEKSSIVESLEPVLHRYRCNWIGGEGDISLTRCFEFVERIIVYYKTFGIKKFRVFYISDFDPVGISMPVSMARKVEYLIYKLLKEYNIDYEDVDVRVEDIAVTPEQVAKFSLKPTRVPKEKITAKDGSSRRTAYATRVKDHLRIFGVKGVVELEALTRTVPTEVPRLLEERLSRYYDTKVDDWIDFEEGRIIKIIRSIMNNVDWNDLPKLGNLRIDWSPLVKYVNAVTPPEGVHNESSDWGIFWLLESKLDYAKQLLRYNQFRLNKKDEVIEKNYPEGQEPDPPKEIYGESLTEEEFEDFLAYAGQKQIDLRAVEETEPEKRTMED